MVLVVELRILHPYTVEEFERGQVYGNLKTAEQLEQPGQGSMLTSSERFYDEIYGEGSYNRSVTRLGEGRLPAWMVKMFPPNALSIIEECWNIYPYCKTTVTAPALQGLKCDTLSMHLQDAGTTENALRLPKELLSRRTVEFIDIGAAQVEPKDYLENRDPSIVKSELTGKGPLTPGWQQREKPIMCAYKVIIADFRYPGLDGCVEKMLVSLMTKLFTLSHRAAFCTLDEWHNLTTEQALDVLDLRRQAGGCRVVEVRRSSLAPSCLEQPQEAKGPGALGLGESAGLAGLPELEKEAAREWDVEEAAKEFLDAEGRASPHSEVRLGPRIGPDNVAVAM